MSKLIAISVPCLVIAWGMRISPIPQQPAVALPTNHGNIDQTIAVSSISWLDILSLPTDNNF